MLKLVKFTGDNAELFQHIVSELEDNAKTNKNLELLQMYATTLAKMPTCDAAFQSLATELEEDVYQARQLHDDALEVQNKILTEFKNGEKVDKI